MNSHLHRGLILALPLLAVACLPARAADRMRAAVDRAACRQRAEEVYRMQNPGEEFRADSYATSTRDAPFAGSGVAGLPNRGLDSRFARERCSTTA